MENFKVKLNNNLFLILWNPNYKCIILVEYLTLKINIVAIFHQN